MGKKYLQTLPGPYKREKKKGMADAVNNMISAEGKQNSGDKDLCSVPSSFLCRGRRAPSKGRPCCHPSLYM
ncbi:hypothetical protein Y1Q_0022427 [Alligator mississippiensis]|uniref:Uncharacterized protein n=1 Tax=Alligator mississippiensis TaxID=8496 RepID=A0A151N0B6_ALLMI|nr:hypothetical protein Y1Q_0022427 [Alligator mississippiensis]